MTGFFKVFIGSNVPTLFS